MDMSLFAREHASQITATACLVVYAILKNKLTTGGIFAGIVTAIIHMLHPWPAFFWLLIVFFGLGTVVTKVSPVFDEWPIKLFLALSPCTNAPFLHQLGFSVIGHNRKAHLTISSTGGSGGEGARTSAQVFANSGFAAVLIFIHGYLLTATPFTSSILSSSPGPYLPQLSRVLPIGIIAQYASVAADTFSSELGILAMSTPFMITAPWRSVPRGTNGGVTVEGLAYGALGSALLTGVAAIALLLSSPQVRIGSLATQLIVTAGLAGSVIDSILGALLQTTVTDRSTGKVVEGPGGIRVKVMKGGSRERMGSDLLNNNGVNFVMAAAASSLAMGVAWSLDISLLR